LHKIFAKTVFVGKKVVFLPTCHSTNAHAARLVENKEATNGQVILTDYQESGRGQRGNAWESAPGDNLLLSIILDASFLDVADNFALTMMTSLGVTDTMEDYIKHEVRIKWPNDIMCDNAKICGILIENIIKGGEFDQSILGIGININQTEFKFGKATSLRNICNQKIDRYDFLNLLLQNIEQRYYQLKKGGLDQITKAYENMLFWKDEIHVYRSGNVFFNGKIRGVERTGRLRLETEDDIRYFSLKEIEYIK